MSAQVRKQATLYRMVMEKHLCPFGLKSLDLLKRHGYEVDDKHLTTREETDAIKERFGVETTPQTIIDGKRIGGYDDLRTYFDMPKAKPESVTYIPVVAIFATTALLSLAMNWGVNGVLFDLQTLIWFIAFSMVVLAIQKLRDVESFSNQFLGYDLLAQRVVRYAYVYPFAEAFAGIVMVTRVPWLMVIGALVAIFIGSINGISVFKAVYIDKRELKCACVGGGSNVPLGFVSLTENIMMVAMGLFMLWRYALV